MESVAARLISVCYIASHEHPLTRTENMCVPCDFELSLTLFDPDELIKIRPRVSVHCTLFSRLTYCIENKRQSAVKNLFSVFHLQHPHIFRKIFILTTTAPSYII